MTMQDAHRAAIRTAVHDELARLTDLPALELPDLARMAIRFALAVANDPVGVIDHYPTTAPDLLTEVVKTLGGDTDAGVLTRAAALLADAQRAYYRGWRTRDDNGDRALLNALVVVDEVREVTLGLDPLDVPRRRTDVAAAR